MNDALPEVPAPENEPVRSYAPGSAERAELKASLTDLGGQSIEICPIVGGEEIRTGETIILRAPHDHELELAVVHLATPSVARRAVNSALEARRRWRRLGWEDRHAVFLRAAELLAGSWRPLINGATMLGQSKNPHQAEIDAACELIDFFRFNVRFARQIYARQPDQSPGVWNRMEYRPLEGFVFAVPPFNFTSISANLPTAPAVMGNVAVWKPALGALFSSYFVYRLLEEAGLPPGVINLLPGRGPEVGPAVLEAPDLAGLHFTGSVETFEQLWRTVGEHLSTYRSYPRIVGETGGKDFVIAHPSADPDALTTAIVRGGYEYQGQKCSAVSRVYVPDEMWPRIREELTDRVRSLSMGPVSDFSNFVNAVIDRSAYEKITGYVELARRDADTDVLAGGDCDDERGYFVAPTLVETTDPHHRLMREEIFGPVVTVYVYPGDRYEAMLDHVDETSPYGLTGAVFARDRAAVATAAEKLRYAAGNFYVNDKPTGAVVGQQPFGGARKSGTDDKAGSPWNLARWTSPRAIKENLDPPTDHRYPFQDPDHA